MFLERVTLETNEDFRPAHIMGSHLPDWPGREQLLWSLWVRSSTYDASEISMGAGQGHCQELVGRFDVAHECIQALTERELHLLRTRGANTGTGTIAARLPLAPKCSMATMIDWLSGVKHKSRYGRELRVWEGIADSGGDYGVGGNYRCGKN